ncbi:MAG: hypothetical protein MH219_20690 [Marinobacter sp.]|nr:hypothetical protein [Marinobacter sp.]
MSDQGWLGPNNPEATLTVEEAYRRRLKEGEVELQFQLWLDRRVQAEYSRVALRQMYRLAKDAGVPLNTVKPTDIGFSLPDELQPIATQITHHINEGHPLQLMPKEEALLRQRYIHHSAHYQTARPLFHSNPHPVACGTSIQTGDSNDQKARNACNSTLHKCPVRWLHSSGHSQMGLPGYVRCSSGCPTPL